MLNTGHEERIAAGVSFRWGDCPPLVEALDGVPSTIEQLQFRRQKSSHRGLSRLQGLKRLWVHNANQELVEEISLLADLEVLFVRGMTAGSLASLGRNAKLKRLILIGGSRMADLDWAAGLPRDLEVLFLEGFAKTSDIGALGGLANLRSLGFEGGMDTSVRIESLAPLARLQKLRNLFLASARVADKSLAPLRQIKTLARLECTIHFPDREFIELAKSLPHLECDWIRMIEEHGSLRAGKAAMMERLRRG